MNKVVCYKLADGDGLCVVVPSPGWRKPGERESEFLQRVIDKDVPAEAEKVQIIDRADVPADKTFRAAWRMNGQAVEVNMPAAREIHKARIREICDQQFLIKVQEFQAALLREDAEAQAAIDAEKTALRDLPDSFDLSKANSPTALAKMWPPDLPRAPGLINQA